MIPYPKPTRPILLGRKIAEYRRYRLMEDATEGSARLYVISPHGTIVAEGPKEITDVCHFYEGVDIGTWK